MERAACDSNQLNAEGSRLKALAVKLSANLSAEPGSLEHHGAMPQCDSIQLEAEGSKLKASPPSYFFCKCIRMFRIEDFIAGHHGHQVFCF